MAALAQTPSGAVPSAPADLTSLCFSDPIWLQTFPLNSGTVLDYFALSPFYDASCNNEKLRSQMLDISHLPAMGPGVEYILHHAVEPHLYIIHKSSRASETKSALVAAYYVLDGTVYQSPHLYSVLGGRVMRCAHQLLDAFRKTEALLVKKRHAEGGDSDEDGGDDDNGGNGTAQQVAADKSDLLVGAASPNPVAASPIPVAGARGADGIKGERGNKRKRGPLAGEAGEGDVGSAPGDRVADARVNRMLVSVLQQFPISSGGAEQARGHLRADS